MGAAACCNHCVRPHTHPALAHPPTHTPYSGAALGTGSAIAHRAVDSMMGPRGGHGEEPAAAAPAGYAQGAPPSQYGSPEEQRCAAQAKAFAECMSRAAGDMGACQFYFESMQVGWV